MTRKILHLMALGALVALCPGLAMAADENSSQSVAEPEVAESTVEFAGMTIAIDPATGRMRPPTPEEAKELAAAMRRTLAMRPTVQPQRPRRLAGGTLAYVLDPSQLKFAVARTETDGTAAQCVDNADQAEAFLSAPSASAAERGLE